MAPEGLHCVPAAGPWRRVSCYTDSNLSCYRTLIINGLGLPSRRGSEAGGKEPSGGAAGCTAAQEPAGVTPTRRAH
jgi:hypothetical protein